MIVDKRKNTRCALKPGVILKFKKSALFGLLKPRTVQYAAIVDLSLGGIRAEYQTNSKWSVDFDLISIGTADKSVDIELADCQIISDSMVGRPIEGTYTRRCGIKFTQLPDTVKNELTQVIEAYNFQPQRSQSWYKAFG
jgi:c-di-GMP-binding flagellar brake protein YcgR